MNAPGFGFIRVIHSDLRSVSRADAIRDAPALNLPEAVSTDESPPLSVGDQVLEPTASPGPPPIGGRELRKYHRGSIRAFADPLGFGYVRDRGHVAGFVSHRFARFPSTPEVSKDEGHWRVESLDLFPS